MPFFIHQDTASYFSIPIELPKVLNLLITANCHVETIVCVES